MSDWKDELRHADVDVDGAIARFANKEERYIKYLKLFAQDDNFARLQSAIEKKECCAAFESCHALKGVVGNLGFRLIFTNVYDACEILRNGRMEHVGELIDEVTDNYNIIVNIIRKYLD